MAHLQTVGLQNVAPGQDKIGRRTIDPRVLDLDHIEVLRGPQGSLYGARSMGGVVRIITKEPDINDTEVTAAKRYAPSIRRA